MTKVGVCDQLCVLNMTDVMEEHLWGASWPVSVEVTPEASSVVASISDRQVDHEEGKKEGRA